MISPSQGQTPLDLTAEVKSSTWFRTHALKREVQQNVVALVVQRTLHTPPSQTGYLRKLGTAVTAKLFGTDPGHIYTVSKSMNAIVQEELKKNRPDKGLKKEELNTRIEKLLNLLANLRNHESEVEAYNRGFYFPKGSILHEVCPDHTVLISTVEQTIDRLRVQLNHFSANQAPSNPEEALAKCRAKLEALRGLKVIDTAFIESEYPVCRQLILDAPLSEQQILDEELNSIINEGYLQTLQASLASEKSEIPSSLIKGCQILGFDRQWIEKHRHEIKNRFIQSMKNWISSHPDWKKMSPAEIVKTFQLMIGQSTVENMEISAEAKEGVARFLGMMRKLEISFNRRLKEAADHYHFPLDQVSSRITYSRFLEEVIQIKPIPQDCLNDPIRLKKELENRSYALGLINANVEEGFIVEKISAHQSTSPIKLKPENTSQEDKLKTDFENTLALLDQRLTDGILPCNASFILTHLPLYETMLQKIPLSSQKILREQLYEIINRHFIEYATTSLIDPEKDLPRSMKMFLLSGLKVNFSKGEIAAGKEAFNNKIKEWMLQTGGEWKTLDPRTLVRQFQEWMIDEALSRGKISDAVKEMVKDTLLQIRKIELEASRKTMSLWEAEKSAFMMSLPAQLKDDPIAKRKISQFDPVPDLGDFVFEAFKELKTDLISDSERFIENLQECLGNYQEMVAKSDEQIEGNFREKLKYLKQVLFSFDREKWLAKHHGKQLFSYRQNLDGNDYVFQRGICAGINLRWIINLLNMKSTDPITSYHDLEKLELHSTSEITGQFHAGNFRQKHSEAGKATLLSDRYRQARMHVVPKLDWRTSEEIDSTGKLKRKATKITYEEALYEGTKFRPASIYPSSNRMLAVHLIPSLIKRESQQPIFENSKGIIQVDVFSIAGRDGVREESAHALGLQIDEKNKVFRFWDVNSGMYEFDTLKDLEEAFTEYTEYVYNELKYVNCYQPVLKSL